MRQSFWSLFHFSLSSETVLAEAEVCYRGNFVCRLSTYMFFMVAHYHLWYLIYIQKCKLLALPLLFLNSDKSKTGSKMIVLLKQKNPFFNSNGFQKIMPLSIHKTIYPWATAQQLNDILLLLLFKPFFFTNCLAPRQVGERKIIFVKKTTLLDCENKKHDHGASTSSRVIFISTSQHQQTHQQQMQQQQQDLKCMSASNKKRKRN